MNIKTKYALGDKITFVNKRGNTLIGVVTRIKIDITDSGSTIEYFTTVNGRRYSIIVLFEKDHD